MPNQMSALDGILKDDLSLEPITQEFQRKNPEYMKYSKEFDALEKKNTFNDLGSNKVLQSNLRKLNTKYKSVITLTSVKKNPQIVPILKKINLAYPNCQVDVMASATLATITIIAASGSSQAAVNPIIYVAPYDSENYESYKRVLKDGANSHVILDPIADKNTGTLNCHTEIHHIKGEAYSKCNIEKNFNLIDSNRVGIVKVTYDNLVGAFAWENRTSNAYHTDVTVESHIYIHGTTIPNPSAQVIAYNMRVYTGSFEREMSLQNRTISFIIPPTSEQLKLSIDSYVRLHSNDEDHSGGGGRCIMSLKSIEVGIVI